jgi:2-methylisocitrate lyase-like PEP mutase family enzyme
LQCHHGLWCKYRHGLAKRAGFKAIHLSGGSVAAGSLGLPDLGISNLDTVLTDVRRLTDVCDLPLLVDVDTGFGSSAFNVARTVKSMRSQSKGWNPRWSVRWPASKPVPT